MNHRPVRSCGLGAALLLVLSAGCVGNIGDTGRAAGGPDGDGPGDGPLACSDGGVTISRHPLRRLTPTQYENTIRDLFGDAEFVADLDEGDESSRARGAPAPENAKAIVRRSSDEHRPAFPCNVDGDADQACFDAFLDGFAARANRHPLSDERARRARAASTRRAPSAPSARP